MEILLATQNEHKKEEILSILPKNLLLKTFADYNFQEDIEETGKTFQENAFIKAKSGYELAGIPSFADDSGLVIEALNGDPGVYSARYAETGSFVDNINKVLKNMKGVKNRKAYFISVICWVNGDEIKYFEGKINGTISTEIKGEQGFGYDPIFIPDGYLKSFAEFSANEKNKISHRALALKKLVRFLDTYQS
ncbi:RdgB/HAM1 family non-canonical purine NTP pyrophosphatase [Apibacter adventoris]|uniref:dITP/XTP pyrophosphatase n=1 Tax=Apibacter adventoris TaxID=1679466 RepID=A0A2S8AF51_9FLAO|nr:RdgB/HAM1 family non-canonical purine NTP pyrophosphatase [Apibacter adventoris]PQL94237.1 non-canonical purine NTP pyrophosphatase, RdgB/HAM1 family [Apibacter adventoris]